MLKPYNELLEQYEDIRFALMMSKVADRNAQEALREMEELENDPTFEIPEESFKKCRKSIQSQYAQVRRRQLGRQTMRIVNKIALIALVGMLCFSTAFAVSEKVRVHTLVFLLEAYGDHTEYSFLPKEQNTTCDITLDVGWVPSTYILIDEGGDKYSQWKSYSNDAGQSLDIEVLQSEHISGSIDTEDSEVTPIEVNGVQGILAYKEVTDRSTVLLLDTERAVEVSIIGFGIDAASILQVAKDISY